MGAVRTIGSPLSGGPPKVIAHRGSSHDFPEHTLGAYERAIEEGADGLECDVRLTADKHLVCVHDRRVNRTSDGTGVVSTLELAQLEGMDWGSWKDAHAGDDEVPDRHHAKILTLRQLIRTAIASGRRPDLVIETKHPTRYAGEVERRLVSVLGEFDLLQPGPDKPEVRIISFSSMAVQRMAKLAPQLERVLLVDSGTSRRYRDGLPANVSIIGPSMSLIRRHPEFVARQHDHGHQVHVWTVDAEEDIELCLRTGVDSITSNRPGLVRARVDEAYAGE